MLENVCSWQRVRHCQYRHVIIEAPPPPFKIKLRHTALFLRSGRPVLYRASMDQDVLPSSSLEDFSGHVNKVVDSHSLQYGIQAFPSLYNLGLLPYLPSTNPTLLIFRSYLVFIHSLSDFIFLLIWRWMSSIRFSNWLIYSSFSAIRT